MATLLLTAVGTLVGGPIGGAIGALAGRQIDHAIIGSSRREGPRLQELQVTTSSYGTPIPRHHGRTRTAGTLIWATELSESSESTGGKGQPSVTLYSYAASFAVALSSRPIQSIGRIWADGNLLRGEGGDLKVGGTLRIYDGHGDQPVDPLIASDMGGDCPAFRHTAYAVFENLQLADFGNRIPALTFEIIADGADDGEVGMAELLEPLAGQVATDRALAGLQGFSIGGKLSDMLASLGAAWPIALSAGNEGLAVRAADLVPEEPPLLPPPAAAGDVDAFGQSIGARRSRGSAGAVIPVALRYYDLARDYQPGLQRADGRATPGLGEVIELPATLDAGEARALINAAAERAGWARERLAWRLAELDPALGPGSIVRVPDMPGLWRVSDWEWREFGVELELLRLPRGPARQPAADSGSVLAPPDLVAAPTILRAFELPWDGLGASDTPRVFAAPSSAGAGWSGAALYADRGGQLHPLGGSGSRRSILGEVLGAVPGSPALRLERSASLVVKLVAEDLALSGSTPEGLANGANRALVGSEVIQFLGAVPLGQGRWRLEGLLRGRGGTEHAAQAGHLAGTAFILLDGTPIALDPAKVGPSSGTSIVAIGLGDAGPVIAPIANPNLSLRPLAPVHPHAARLSDGGLLLRWTRRARGAWAWPDEVDAPLVEQLETYRVGLGPAEAPILSWQVAEPKLSVDAATLSALKSAHPGAAFWVRQIGSFAQSDALLLTTLP